MRQAQKKKSDSDLKAVKKAPIIKPVTENTFQIEEGIPMQKTMRSTNLVLRVIDSIFTLPVTNSNTPATEQKSIFVPKSEIPSSPTSLGSAVGVSIKRNKYPISCKSSVIKVKGEITGVRFWRTS